MGRGVSPVVRASIYVHKCIGAEFAEDYPRMLCHCGSCSITLMECDIENSTHGLGQHLDAVASSALSRRVGWSASHWSEERNVKTSIGIITLLIYTPRPSALISRTEHGLALGIDQGVVHLDGTFSNACQNHACDAVAQRLQQRLIEGQSRPIGRSRTGRGPGGPAGDAGEGGVQGAEDTRAVGLEIVDDGVGPGVEGVGGDGGGGEAVDLLDGTDGGT